MIRRKIRGTPAIALALVAALPAFAAAQTAATQGARGGAAADAAKRGAQTAKTSPARIQPQGFSVVLVVADLQATSGQDDVPPAARKALTDMKDFLPYKSYKLLDAAWLLGQGSSGNITRLRGLDEQEYELRLFSQPTAHPGDASARVFVRFTLKDSPTEDPHAEAVSAVAEHQRQTAAELERQTAALRAKLTGVQQELAKKRQSLGEQNAEVRAAEKEVQRLQREVAASARASERRAVTVTQQLPQKRYERAASRAVIDTSFSMDVGETVVVGTSRLKGNGKALIALLTAVPPKGKI